MTAYSPLGSGLKPKVAELPPLLEHPTICEIAEAHNKTPAQVCIRWAIDREMVVIPKSITPSRIEENYNVWDFELTKEELDSLDRLDARCRFVEPSFYSFK